MKSGVVVLEQLYTRNADRLWELELAEFVHSTVAHKSAEQLARCVEKASQGLHLEPTEDEAEVRMLTLYWEWPVPLTAP